MPELRKDPIIDRWVIIAAERGRIQLNSTARLIRSRHLDPFAPGNESRTPPEVAASGASRRCRAQFTRLASARGA